MLIGFLPVILSRTSLLLLLMCCVIVCWDNRGMLISYKWVGKLSALRTERAHHPYCLFAAMFLDLPLSSEVWRFFLEDVNSTDTREQNCCGSILEWEWKWLEQVAALPTDNLDLTDPYAPAIHFKLQSVLLISVFANFV